MPVVEVHLIAGYAAEAKARLSRALTAAVRQVLPAAPDAVTVLLHEVPRENYLRGGTHRDPAPALPDPAAMVRDFLAAMEARDLARARGFLAEGFEMRFPGQPPMHRLEELVAWSAPRYRFVKKTYDGIEVAGGEVQVNGPVIVYAFGRLHGEWPDGTPFEGIRFVDRFEIAGGRFVRQDVWNDMAEVKAQEGRA